MVFSGNVKDEAGKPISGIKVTYLEKSWGGSPPHVDTFYVNQSVLNTRFDGSIPRDTFWTIMSMPKVDRGNIKVLFEDEDGEENGGKFQRDSINGNQMKIEEIRSYMYSVSFDKQLKKEK